MKHDMVYTIPMTNKTITKENTHLLLFSESGISFPKQKRLKAFAARAAPVRPTFDVSTIGGSITDSITNKSPKSPPTAKPIA